MNSIALSLATLLTLASGSPTPGFGPGSPSIPDSEVDVEHPGVVFVQRLVADGDPQPCNGFLVTPRLVVTARRCVSELLKGQQAGEGACGTVGPDGAVVAYDQLGDVFDPSQLTVSAGEQISASAPATGVARIHVPPVGSTSACGNDVALLELAQPLAGVPSIPLRLLDAPRAEEPVAAVGYGVAANEPPTRRVRWDAMITDVGQRVVEDRIVTTPRELLVNFGPCTTAGGPALDFQGRAIGVMTRVEGSDCSTVVYNRLDVLADWLSDTARDVAHAHGDARPDWILTVPVTEDPKPAEVAQPAPVLEEEAPAQEAAGGCSSASGAPALALLPLLAAALRRRGSAARAAVDQLA